MCVCVCVKLLVGLKSLMIGSGAEVMEAVLQKVRSFSPAKCLSQWVAHIVRMDDSHIPPPNRSNGRISRRKKARWKA